MVLLCIPAVSYVFWRLSRHLRPRLPNCYNSELNVKFLTSHRDKSRLLIEEARCLTHLSHAYHVKHDFKKSYMVALEQLNAAEEAEEDWIEVNYFTSIELLLRAIPCHTFCVCQILTGTFQ